MKKCFSCSIILLTLFFLRCGVIRDTPKYSFADGYYRSKIFNQKLAKVYVNNTEDSVVVYHHSDNNDSVSEVNGLKISFPLIKSGSSIPTYNFRQSSFDVDFLTIPFKYRPLSKMLPPQFNTNLNGVIYIGYRNDMYRIKYKKTPVKTFVRQTNHYGFSFGLFSGFGGTAMNTWVTNNQISSEYDGVVWSKGVAAIIGIDNFSIGLALGIDDLLESNRKYWIYQNKPWFGLAFGLNLN